MLRGTKNLTRQQIQDALDKNVARLGTGMNMRMLRGFGGLGLGAVTFTIETKRSQPPRRPGYPSPDPPRAHPARQRVRGDEERANRRHRTGPSPIPFARALTTFSACCRKYPSDDVRYVPTLDEQIERLKKARLDQVALAVSRLPRSRAR